MCSEIEESIMLKQVSLSSFSPLPLLVGDILSHFLKVKSWTFGLSTFRAFRNRVCPGSKCCFLVTKSSYSFVTIALQAFLFMGFSRQEYWCGLPFPSPVDLPNPGIKAGSSALQAESLLTEL